MPEDRQQLGLPHCIRCTVGMAGSVDGYHLVCARVAVVGPTKGDVVFMSPTNFV